MSQEANAGLSLGHRREIAGQCPRCGDDADPCRCRPKLNTYQRDWRAQRRRRGECVDCGVKSRKYRCKGCKKRRGEIKRRRGVDQAKPSGFRTTVEVDARYSDGRVRQRYMGRGTRGAPNREQLEAEDVRTVEIMVREASKGRDALAEAGRLPQDMPRIQRAAARREALAAVGLAVRLGLEVMRRNGIDTEAFDTGDE